jgi:hypothetical protein
MGGCRPPHGRASVGGEAGGDNHKMIPWHERHYKKGVAGMGVGRNSFAVYDRVVVDVVVGLGELKRGLATEEERASRKRRLLKGPKEFRR